jgi:hypothetical protein
VKRFRLPFSNVLTTAIVIWSVSGTGQSALTTNSVASQLVLAQHAENLDQLAREPSIVEHPDGTLFVSGYGRPLEGGSQRVPRLWKSADHSATWTRVNVGTEADGAVANSDVSLAVAGDGALYFATMEFDRKAEEGLHIVVGVSKDAGTWHWSMVSKKRFDDRPWVAGSGRNCACYMERRQRCLPHLDWGSRCHVGRCSNDPPGWRLQLSRRRTPGPGGGARCPKLGIREQVY